MLLDFGKYLYLLIRYPYDIITKCQRQRFLTFDINKKIYLQKAI